jgi:hypothetical protein
MGGIACHYIRNQVYPFKRYPLKAQECASYGNQQVKGKASGDKLKDTAVTVHGGLAIGWRLIYFFYSVLHPFFPDDGHFGVTAFADGIHP